MTTFERATEIPVPAPDLFAWHERPGAFERLAPPWERIEVVARDGSIRDGDRLVMKLRKGPLRLTWEALHRDYVAGSQFVDEQVRGPFSRWVHTHRVEPAGVGRARLVDSVDYRLPLGCLGRLLGGRSTRRMLERMFTFRHARTQSDLTRHARYSEADRMKIVIAGASGLVGTALRAFLTTGGHEVVPLVRRGGDGVPWDPARGELDPAALEGVDAVICLSGANLAEGRWTDARKKVLIDSRLDTTRLLAETIAKLERKPRVFLAASAIGLYGDTGQAEVDESSPRGEGFLAELCEDWEAAAAPAREAGVRVAYLRTGLVLSPQGGLLDALMTPFKLGVGGRIGSGDQWMSWISLDDEVGAIHFLLQDERAEGAFNLVAPNPVDNRTLTKTLGRVLKRPTIFPVPRFALKALFGGEKAEQTALSSARVLPRRLEELGFTFEWPDLEGALRHILGRAG